MMLLMPSSMEDAQGVVRPLQTADLPALMEIQRACYGPAYVEGHDVFARRLASPANCSRVLQRDGEVLAYLAAYWSERGKVTPLHGDFDASPAPDVLYLHDMAVHPAQAGQRLARRLLQALWAEALGRGIRHSSLVSVQGSQDYWRRQGYDAQVLHDGVQARRLKSYGDHAIYMLRALPARIELSACLETGDNARYA